MLNDRVTLVTGGGTVIGKAIGVQFAKSGSKVALVFRDPGHLQSAISERQTIQLAQHYNPHYCECSPRRTAPALHA